MRIEILFIPMGSRAKCIIRGRVFCDRQNVEFPKVFMTYPFYMKQFFGNSSEIRSFFSKGRPVRKVIDSEKLYAPYHLHECDRIR